MLFQHGSGIYAIHTAKADTEYQDKLQMLHQVRSANTKPKLCNMCIVDQRVTHSRGTCRQAKDREERSMYKSKRLTTSASKRSTVLHSLCVMLRGLFMQIRNSSFVML